jgi:hypothetical protein
VAIVVASSPHSLSIDRTGCAIKPDVGSPTVCMKYIEPNSNERPATLVETDALDNVRSAIGAARSSAVVGIVLRSAVVEKIFSCGYLH